jgi:hypothetical protein
MCFRRQRRTTNPSRARICSLRSGRRDFAACGVIAFAALLRQPERVAARRGFVATTDGIFLEPIGRANSAALGVPTPGTRRGR